MVSGGRLCGGYCNFEISDFFIKVGLDIDAYIPIWHELKSVYRLYWDIGYRK